VVVQARTGSSRLPGKVLLPVAGATLLERMVERVRAARTPFDLVVATTDEDRDAAIVDVCDSLGVHCYRGHPTDLLDRHYWAALERSAEAVVKIPSDCPLIDPAVIDRVLSVYLEDPERYAFVSNLHPATYPDGNDVEVVSFAALAQAHGEARASFYREHTTPFVWDQPQRFRVRNVEWETGRDLSMTHRFTIDYPADYTFVSTVFERLYPGNRLFSLDDILDLLESEPRILSLNARYAGVNWYRHHLSELQTVTSRETRNLEVEA
jgi:spore coat polysaccharide biosynthesis protein SpsF